MDKRGAEQRKNLKKTRPRADKKFEKRDLEEHQWRSGVQPYE